MVATVDQNVVVLDLRPGRDGGANEANGFIQREAERRLVALLTQGRTMGTPSTQRRAPVSNIIDDRYHDAIFINARRGAGKTTFLIKVLGSFEDREPVKAVNGKALRSLGIIDPTLVETKQHIVVVVIDRIRAAVDAAQRTAKGVPPGLYEAFQQSLGKLARGLAMLDGIGSDAFYGREWADAEFVLDQGLEDARAAVEFERELHGFINHACEFLDIHSFVLAIDDIDTWFERGWPVLEAVRKYFTSTRLQIVLSGDLELYSLLVRASQWKQMGKDFLGAEQWLEGKTSSHGKMASITRKIDELQDQYLIKVLKPERRIDLQPLLDFKATLRLKVSDDQSGSLEADAFIACFCAEALGLHSAADRRDVLDLLLRLPTRSALQIMLAAADMVVSPDVKSRRRALDGLRYVAWTDLLNLELSPGDTQALAPRMLTTLLARWFTEAGLWRTMPRFHPETLDAGYGLPAIFGGALAVESFREDPSQMIAYWLKVSTIREMLDGNRVTENEPTGDQRPLTDLIDHLNLTSLETSLQTVSRLAAWELVLKRQVRPGVYFSVVSVPLDRVREREAAARDLYGKPYKQGGRIGGQLTSLVRNVEDPDKENVPAPLRMFHSKLEDAGWAFPAKDVGFQGSFANDILGLTGKVGGAAQLVAALPVLEIVSGQQKGQGGYSFLRVVATIGELLEAASEETITDEALAGRIRSVLSAAALLRSYPTPGTDEELGDARSTRKAAVNFVEDIDDAADEDDSGDAGTHDAAGQTALVDAIADWLKTWRGRIRPLAPLVLSRIWARFNYAHRSVRERLKHLESRYLGTFMFRSLTVFLHSVLIESVRASGAVASSNSNNNPVTAPEPFVSLLREIGNEARGIPGWGSEELSLFEALFTCPFWAYFLPRHADIRWKREPKANEAIYEAYLARRAAYGLKDADGFAKVLYRPDGGAKEVEFEGLYDILNTVHMQGNPRKASGSTAGNKAPAAEAAEGQA